MRAAPGSGMAPAVVARVAGCLYLGFVLASFLADVVADIGLTDAEVLAATAADSPAALRGGLALFALAALLFLLAAWALYVLLRPVQPRLALLFLLLNAVGVAVHAASIIPLLFLLADDAGRLDAFTAEQAEGLALAAIDAHALGLVIAQVFFGTWVFPLGYLVLRSGFLPRTLGVLLIADGVAILFWFFQAMLVPDSPELSYPAWAISLVAEAGLALWLLIRGVSPPREG